MPNAIIVELEKIQKTFLWRNSHVKIKHQTLCNSFETGGLKNVDINVKTTSRKKIALLLGSKTIR